MELLPRTRKPSRCVVSQAVLRSEAEPGARAFLAAPPSGKTRMEPAVFVTELRTRCPSTQLCAVQEASALSATTRSGLQPEKEKGGLLLPQHRDDSSSIRRRAADLYVPSYLGSPTAFDLAVTAPSQQETLGEAAHTSLAAAFCVVCGNQSSTFGQCCSMSWARG
jgi:hypothetical protein